VSGSSLPGKTSGSFGSTASGSSGSFIQVWQWIFFISLLIVAGSAALAFVMHKGKKKKRGAVYTEGDCTDDENSDAYQSSPMMREHTPMMIREQSGPQFVSGITGPPLMAPPPVMAPPMMAAAAPPVSARYAQPVMSPSSAMPIMRELRPAYEPQPAYSARGGMNAPVELMIR
jgi:hypothetical protein